MDDQQNQQIGGQYGIRGFPTIKVGKLKPKHDGDSKEDVAKQKI